MQHCFHSHLYFHYLYLSVIFGFWAPKSICKRFRLWDAFLLSLVTAAAVSTLNAVPSPLSARAFTRIFNNRRLHSLSSNARQWGGEFCVYCCQESALELDGAVIPPLLDQKVCNRSHFSDGGQTYLGFVPSECHHLETYTPFVCCRPHDLTFCHICFSFAWRSCRRDWDIWLNWRDVCEADACRWVSLTRSHSLNPGFQLPCFCFDRIPVSPDSSWKWSFHPRKNFFSSTTQIFSETNN